MHEAAEKRRPPGWRFDFEAADAAVRQLEATAQSLFEGVAAIEHDIPAAVEDFTGRFREVFDVETGRHTLAARLIANELFELAAQIRAQAVLAAATWAP